MNFSATPSPNGITFLGTNGRTYMVPNSDANFAAVRDKMLAVQKNQSRDPAAAQTAWAEMTNIVDGKTVTPKPRRSPTAKDKNPNRATSVAMVEHVDLVSNRWVDLDETRGMSKEQADRFIAKQGYPTSYRIKGDDTRLQAVIDVRLGGGKHIYGTVFDPVTVLVNGVERAQFSGEGLSGHRQAFDYCKKTFGFADGDIHYLCANANFLRPVEDVKLREVLGKVNIVVHGEGQRSFSEYRSAAQAVQECYGFTDGDMIGIYHDYREDYDNQ